MQNTYDDFYDTTLIHLTSNHMQKGLFMAEHSFVPNCECEKDKRRNERERKKKLCKFYQNF